MTNANTCGNKARI